MYCPSGEAPKPCPAGTYNPSTGIGSEDECLGCPPGQFCHKRGLNATSGNCSEGFFCKGNATAPNPTDTVTGEFVFCCSLRLYAVEYYLNIRD